MKSNRLKNLGAILIFAFASISCDKVDEFKELADVNVSTSFEQNFSLDFPVATETDGSIIMDGTDTIYRDNDDINDYLDKLKGMKVTRMYALVSNYEGALGSAFSGQVILGPGYEVNIPTTLMESASANGDQIEITDANGAFDYFGEQLLTHNEVIYGIDFRFSEAPVKCNLQIYYEVEVTANPL